MNPLLKKFLSVVISATILIVAYYGNYLPLKKSQAFISATHSYDPKDSVTQLESLLSAPLDVPSPIGQSELVRNVAGIVLNYTSLDEAPELVNYVESYYAPIIDRGRGMNFAQDLYVLGLLHESVAVNHRDGNQLQIAQIYFEKGLQASPGRPQFLYSLFDVYRMEGDVVKAKETGDLILKQWPGSEDTRKNLDQFLKDNPPKNKK